MYTIITMCSSPWIKAEVVRDGNLDSQSAGYVKFSVDYSQLANKQTLDAIASIFKNKEEHKYLIADLKNIRIDNTEVPSSSEMLDTYTNIILQGKKIELVFNEGELYVNIIVV